MAKKKRETVRTCGQCIHEFACSAWNIGHIHDMDATHCVNFETLEEFKKMVFAIFKQNMDKAE